MPLSKLANDQELPINSENSRKYPRHSYPYKQRIAYQATCKKFSELDFNLVEFLDISREGFAFVIRGLPRGDSIIAELGQNGVFLHILAKIENVTPIEHRGQWMMRVGCSMMRRIDPNQDSLDRPANSAIKESVV